MRWVPASAAAVAIAVIVLAGGTQSGAALFVIGWLALVVLLSCLVQRGGAIVGVVGLLPSVLIAGYAFMSGLAGLGAMDCGTSCQERFAREEILIEHSLLASGLLGAVGVLSIVTLVVSGLRRRQAEPAALPRALLRD